MTRDVSAEAAADRYPVEVEAGVDYREWLAAEGRDLEPDPADVGDEDLPGMWSHSDFLGGDPDPRSYAQRERDRAAAEDGAA